MSIREVVGEAPSPSHPNNKRKRKDVFFSCVFFTHTRRGVDSGI